jgi:AmiR/NasT family two-component response regulator
MAKQLFTLIESPRHPNFMALYKDLGIKEHCFNSMRKVIKQLKSHPPDFIVAEFFYGYGNNYAGVNISNLDVMLYSLQKYSPATKVIVLVDKKERQYVDKLNDIIPLHAVLVRPFSEKLMLDTLSYDKPL